jgi:hypothetical protein
MLALLFTKSKEWLLKDDAIKVMVGDEDLPIWELMEWSKH